MERRTFFKQAAAGMAALSMPRFLLAMPQAADIANPAPANPFSDWHGIDEAVLRQVLAELTANGADDAELYFQHARETNIQMQNGIVNAAASSIEHGVGLRVVRDGRVGFAYTEDLTLEAMRQAARTAAAIADGSAASVPQHLDPRAVGDLYSVDRPWAETGLDERFGLVQRVDTLVRAAEPAVDKIQVVLQDREERVLIATLDGALVSDQRPQTTLICIVGARKGGEIQSNNATLSARDGIGTYTDARLKEFATSVTQRTMALFGARRPPAGELPVVLSAGASAVLLHEAIGHPMEADANRIGASVYSDMIGKPVAEPFVNVVDQATVPKSLGALNVDDEGSGTQQTNLVSGGVLSSYLHDKISARHYGVASTGSGRRQSYRYPVLPRMSCTFMENGPHKRDEIIASVKKGIMAETFTGGQVDLAAGDFTFYIKTGWLIEDGKVTAPLKDVNLIGNGPEVLKRISMVADDLAFDPGGWTCGKEGQSVPVSLGMPTALVSKMTVGGQNDA